MGDDHASGTVGYSGQERKLAPPESMAPTAETQGAGPRVWNTYSLPLLLGGSSSNRSDRLSDPFSTLSNKISYQPIKHNITLGDDHASGTVGYSGQERKLAPPESMAPTAETQGAGPRVRNNPYAATAPRMILV